MRAKRSMVWAIAGVFAMVGWGGWGEGGAAAQQGTPPNYGIDFVTIGAPGNRATTPQETPIDTAVPLGAVGYEYRLSRTEITASQWVEFVRAYAPYSGGSRTDSNLTGLWIHPTSLDPQQDPGYVITPGAENYPTDMSWRMAARYCNWLHNGKVNEAWAFENGAYDTSTFTTNPNGHSNDQLAHNPGAQFWIPTQDEWVKGVYYDLNRYGQGQEGYWLYPNGTNQILVPGLPSEGGQTSAGIINLFGFPVAQYPDVQTPWGLLDASGGMGEFTETTYSPSTTRSRNVRGSFTGDSLWQFSDRIDIYGYGLAGLRIASVVPGPGTLVILCGLTMAVIGRSRRGVSEPMNKPANSPRMSMSRKAGGVAVVLFATTAPAFAQPHNPPDYGINFVTIGAPGNRPANATEAPNWNGFEVGAVDHEYRIARTELTVSQWYEFVTAYSPFYGGNQTLTAFTSRWILPTSPGFVITPGTANFPADMSWHMAARYCNWLHNGKVNEAWAFESGAYDTSTFTRNPDGSRNDQLTRSPGARFWIPSLDEWDKAVYYDQNRYGPGQDGYWMYPNGTDTPLVSGLSGEGGQTSMGAPSLFGWGIDVGSYATVMSPWGLLDASGGRSEWTEGCDGIYVRDRRRWLGGTDTDDFMNSVYDRIDVDMPMAPDVSWGLRIASAVPSPGTTVLNASALVWLISRRKRKHETCHAFRTMCCVCHQ